MPLTSTDKHTHAHTDLPHMCRENQSYTNAVEEGKVVKIYAFGKTLKYNEANWRTM